MLVRRAIEPGYGKWVFPGGYVDRGEEVQAAAVREAREETGLDVRLDGLVNIYSYAGRAPVIIVYAATMIGGCLACDDEGLEARFFDADAIPWDDARVPQHPRGAAGVSRQPKRRQRPPTRPRYGECRLRRDSRADYATVTSLAR